MKTPLRKKILFYSVPFVAFLILAELGLRLGDQLLPVRVVCFHPIYEREYCANSEGTLRHNNRIKVNRYGMLDQEYVKTRTPGALRIAVLGDSMTAGEEVPRGNRYHELWEQALPKRLGRDVEVLNFGVRGFGTWESLQMYHLKARQFQPDFTVLSFYWGNDVENNLQALLESQPNPLRGQYKVSLTRKINLARKGFNKWLWNHSAVYHLTRRGYNKMETQVKNFLEDDTQRTVRIQKEYKTKPQPFEHARQGRAFRPPALGEDLESIVDDKFFFDSEGWHLTRRLIRKLNSEVLESGSQLVVIHFMDVEQYYDYPSLALREFDTFLMQEGIPHLNMHPAFNRLDRKSLAAKTFENDSHFNAAGHKFLADNSIDFLVRQILGSGRVT